MLHYLQNDAVQLMHSLRFGSGGGNILFDCSSRSLNIKLRVAYFAFYPDSYQALYFYSM